MKGIELSSQLGRKVVNGRILEDWKSDYSDGLLLMSKNNGFQASPTQFLKNISA